MSWKRRLLKANGNKFGAVKAQGPGGRMYDSTAERDRALELRLLETVGEVSEIQEQPRLELVPGVHYKPDFSYVQAGRRVWEDVKGVETERFRLICQLWRNFGPGALLITKRGARGFKVVKSIYPNTKGGDSNGEGKQGLQGIEGFQGQQGQQGR